MIAALSLFLCAQAQETSAQEAKCVEGDVLVKFTIEITPEQGPNGEIIVGIPSVDSLNQFYGLVSMSQVYRGPLSIAKKLWKLVFPPEIDEPAVAHVYSLDSYIEYAQPNYLLRVADTWPNDTYRDSCWYHRDSLRYLQSRLAWDYTTGSDTVIISIDDTGVHWKHDDLSGNPAHPGNIWENLAEDADSDGTVLEWAFTGEDWE